MKNQRLYGILLLAIIVVPALFYYYGQFKNTPVEKVATPEPKKVVVPPQALPDQAKPMIIAPPLKKGSRPFYGSLPQGITDIRKLPMANKPVKEWLPRLKVNLQKQGGDRLKELKVIPEESYVISDGGAGRYVERVTVKLTAKDGGYTSFFAEVDSETGYVLKTWGVAIQEKTPHHH